MFQEQIAQHTAEHFRTHVEAILDEIRAGFTGTDKLTTAVPEVTDDTLVGGVMQVELERLPIIGIDCSEKQEIPSGESLYYCQYTGAFAGLVSAPSANEADRLCKRYAAAAEMFVREHQFLHGYSTTNFTFRELYYINTQLSGAMEVELEKDERSWVAGFTMNVAWVTSEDQPRQH